MVSAVQAAPTWPVPKAAHCRQWGGRPGAAWALTEHIGGPVPGHEAGVIPVAHAFLEDALAEVLAEAAAGGHQAVIAGVGLREPAQDRPGHQPAIGQHREHGAGRPAAGARGTAGRGHLSCSSPPRLPPRALPSAKPGFPLGAGVLTPPRRPLRSSEPGPPAGHPGASAAPLSPGFPWDPLSACLTAGSRPGSAAPRPAPPAGSLRLRGL